MANGTAVGAHGSGTWLVEAKLLRDSELARRGTHSGLHAEIHSTVVEIARLARGFDGRNVSRPRCAPRVRAARDILNAGRCQEALRMLQEVRTLLESGGFGDRPSYRKNPVEAPRHRSGHVRSVRFVRRSASARGCTVRDTVPRPAVGRIVILSLVVALALMSAIPAPTRADATAAIGSGGGSPTFTFENLTTTLDSEGTLGPCCWVAQTVFGKGPAVHDFLTVGGNGFTVDKNGPLPSPPSVAGRGFLTGASWDGHEFLLVGQVYSPHAGVLMFSYDPVSNSITDLTGLFDSSLSANATLLEATWDGSAFDILGLLDVNAFTHPTSILVFSYNPSTGGLSNLTSSVPTWFQPVKTCACIGAQDMVATPAGLFFLLTFPDGRASFGLLSSTSFSNLSSLLPSGFVVSHSDGTLTADYTYTMAWNGSALFVAGSFPSSVLALFSYNPSSGQLTNYSASLSAYPGIPIAIAADAGSIYLSGITVPCCSIPNTPLFVALDTASLLVTNLDPFLPLSFGPVAAFAFNQRTIFVAGGTFFNIQYGLLKPRG